ncbi:hypothetical protein E3Q23_02229 [Wallemia mellicola]|nr:hypothetical protein E3Q23_02229 [Wallemia mellicola]TIB91774.1 NAD(P)-binding protein [Wallemia mellicola]TIC27397.1 NAD(P)-binding protein [Wallemia mellicola]TIC74287.1 NAD(P)-binding protein [Wallemia mellicola]
MRRTQTLKDHYDYYDKWLGRMVRVDYISDTMTDATLLALFRPAGPIAHIHIEKVYDKWDVFHYAVIVFHSKLHARLSTVLSGMFLAGSYIYVALVSSCCEIVPYSPRTLGDMEYHSQAGSLLEHKERHWLRNSLSCVSIFDKQTVPTMVSKMEILTMPHPSFCVTDTIESGTKLEDADECRYLASLEDDRVERGNTYEDWKELDSRIHKTHSSHKIQIQPLGSSQRDNLPSRNQQKHSESRNNNCVVLS